MCHFYSYTLLRLNKRNIRIKMEFPKLYVKRSVNKNTIKA